MAWKWVELLPRELGTCLTQCLHIGGRVPLGSPELTLAHCRHLDDFPGQAGPLEHS